ncbi:MAG: M24 family metallopeptidase [Candidatus Omnitrophica bacterium]|nr:M24 family metallopeptidase [Candidatus Omnitrophota bacterium]
MAQLKNKKQIKALKIAAKITVGIFKEITKKIKPGASESDIVKEIEAIIKQKGLKRSFRTIVASGPNSAKPHAEPTNRKFKTNDIIVIDFGIIYKGYHSDMTRTFVLGRIDSKMKLLYKVVKKAQAKAIKKVKPGMKISEFVKYVNDYIRSKKLGKYILHSLGHGIGLKVHEAPKLSEKNKGLIKKGMVLAIEPGLYIKGLGGVRMEDMVLIKDTGCEVLTK